VSLSGAAVSCSTRRNVSTKGSPKPMASKVAEYHRGDMEISEQVSTYHAVMSASKWGSLAIGDAVLFLTLWFCTGAGFLGALITAVVVAVLGVFFLRGGGAH